MHAAIRGVVDHHYFFGHTTAPTYGRATPTWTDVLTHIGATIGG